ncbi:MAG TPA: sigma-70 family RNA polymerase sigma factor [Blastocatellia bacterium]|nr:sigma-70 family RNA polymerase sigma factor [Blastocatellia bacterium]
MNPEEFREAFRKEIGQVLTRITRRYGVTDDELALAFYSSAKKYLWSGGKGGDAASNHGSPGSANSDGAGNVGQFLESLNCEDLCLAVACAKGDETAWEDFYREYRSYLINVSRSMTQDAGAAEQLADSTFADLYGLRESGGARVSKFSFYSGRGSLRGWLRAVLFQLSADSHRQSSRFVQTEEAEDMDRLAMAAAPEKQPSTETDFIHKRYRVAVSEALRKGIEQLEARDRLLLAYYYCDELTLREIGRLFDVHEATISRWLTKVQKKLRKLVEKGLEKEHRFNRREASEAMQMAADGIDISVRDYLVQSLPTDSQAAAAKNRQRR